MRRRRNHAVLAVASLFLLGNLGATAGAGGYFRVEERAGAWWFVTPQGEPFWSHGVNSITRGASREEYDEKRPVYASWRYYQDDDQWATDALDRLRQWNFNTLGGWHDRRLRRGALPSTIVLHVGTYAGAPWNDMFAEEFVNVADRVAKRLVEPHREDAKLIGWFVDNELPWYPEVLFNFHLKQPATSKTRQQLVAMLRQRYDGDFAALQQDFAADAGIAGFDQLEEGGVLTPLPGGRGGEAIQSFAELLADRYYSVVCGAVRKVDPNHLLLGDRYHGYCPDAVVKAAGRHLDVVSTNYDWPAGVDGYLPLAYLRRLHSLSGKPVLVTEYYASATDNQSGNPNSGGLFVVVPDQAQRASVARERLTMFAAEPYIIGAHWFAYADEPPQGRSDGEDYNFGLVDIHNAPYEKVTTALKDAHASAATLHASAASKAIAGEQTVDVPKLSDDVAVESIDAHLLGQARPQPSTEGALADLSVAWNDDAIYVTLAGNHYLPESTYAEAPAPIGEGLDWKLEIDAAEKSAAAGLRMLSAQAEITPPEARFAHWQRGVRFSATIAVAPASVGKGRWKQGDKITLRSNLEDRRLHAGSDWNATFTLVGAAKADLGKTRHDSSRRTRFVGNSIRSSTEEAGQ